MVSKEERQKERGWVSEKGRVFEGNRPDGGCVCGV